MAIDELAQICEELLPHPRRVLDEPVIAICLDARRAGGARKRVAAVRGSDPEDVVVEVLRDLLRDDGATERHVSGRHALRESHDVRDDALVVGAEPLPRASEAGHDLVEHEEDPVAIAERAQAPEVAVGWDEDP